MKSPKLIVPKFVTVD